MKICTVGILVEDIFKKSRILVCLQFLILLFFIMQKVFNSNENFFFYRLISRFIYKNVLFSPFFVDAVTPQFIDSRY